MALRLEPFERTHAPAAASMSVASLEELRGRVPSLPADMADVERVAERLERMAGVAALDDGNLVGYLTGLFPIARFRGTTRVGVYVPGWAHGAIGDRAGVTRAMYRAAAEGWSAAGCDVHAITVLGNDAESVHTWFWSGFGMGLVDAVRPTTPLDVSTPARSSVRRATTDDAGALAQLDVEHARHYAISPVFMTPPIAYDAERWRAFLELSGNTAWLAEDDREPFGFMRFDVEFGGSDVVESPAGVFISGAYVRAAHRRRGAAAALLDAALRHYAAAGRAFCAVDFEAFNPEATAFWMRHFTPVCHTLMRVPENPSSSPGG